MMVYICLCYSVYSPLSFPHCVLKSVLYVCLHCSPAHSFISNIFPDSTHMHWYMIYASLFLTYFIPYQSILYACFSQILLTVE